MLTVVVSRQFGRKEAENMVRLKHTAVCTCTCTYGLIVDDIESDRLILISFFAEQHTDKLAFSICGPNSR